MQDLFAIRKYYGDPNELIRNIKSWGISKIEYVDTRRLPFIPTALKLTFMLGALGLLAGEKRKYKTPTPNMALTA